MLSHEEIDLLQRALDSLESSEGMSDLMGDMLGAMLVGDKSEREKLMEERRVREEGKRVQRQRIKERITLLKAKLIQMKDASEVERILSAEPAKASAR